VTQVLALDVGTSAVRAQRFDERCRPAGELGKRLYVGVSDPDEIAAAVRAAIADAGGADGVDAVGVSCFGHSLLPLDAAGKPLTPILGWRDPRAVDATRKLAEKVDADAVFARTGAPLHPSFWPAKLAWLATRSRDVSIYVTFAEYLYAQLAGAEPRMSVSSASGTGLFNLHTRAWDEELLDVLNLDIARLPPVSDNLTGGWQPALLDGACANLGAGAVGETTAALTVGTSCTLRRVYYTDEPRPRRGLFLYLVGGSRVVEGGALSDGGNLFHWLNRTLAEDHSSLLERGPGEHGLSFLPFLGGERSTGWRLQARGAVHGLTFDTTPRDIRQAALEAIGFRLAAVLALLPEVEEIVATGTVLVRDPEWMQLTADAIGHAIAAGEGEASLRGAAVAALERLGASPDAAELGPRIEPRPELVGDYDAAREQHRRLYEAAT
jgi:gluconokinase